MSKRGSVCIAIVATLVAISACGGSVEDQASYGGRPPRAGFTPLATCADTPPLATIARGVAVDYIESRFEFIRQDGHREVTVLDSVGDPCSAAEDRQRCFDALDAIARKNDVSACQPMKLGCAAQYLVYTRGDEVHAVPPGLSLAAMFAPIESLEEAVFVLLSDTRGCASSYRETTDGFELAIRYESDGGCGSTETLVVDVVMRVGRDGALSELESTQSTRPHRAYSCVG